VADPAHTPAPEGQGLCREVSGLDTGPIRDRVGADLDVAIAVFSDSYVPHQNRMKLTIATPDSVG
jgi:hypothetical protein